MNCCTFIELGDEAKVGFCLSGQTVGCSGLFRVARRKNITVKEALEINGWMCDLLRMNSKDELDQFIVLWDKVQFVKLSTGPDNIRWLLAADSCYPAASALFSDDPDSVPDNIR